MRKLPEYSSASAPAVSTPVGPASDDDDVQGPVVDQRRILVRGLPQAKDLVLEPHGVAERVHRERMLGRALDAEEVDLRAEPEDEVVVAQRPELVERHLARLQVDRGHAVLMEPSVVLLVEEVADRMADGGLLEEPCGHLVQERLEGVVVVLVDEHDVDVALVQFLSGADPGEAAPEDEDARPRGAGSIAHPSQGTCRPVHPLTPSG